MSKATYISISDRYTPTRESFDSVDDFLAMCEGFGEKTELTRNGAGYWTDETGERVLEEEETETETETETAIVGQTPATSTSWLRAFGGAYSAPLPAGNVYFARAARKDGDELVTKADRMTLPGATAYCQDLLRRGFAVAAVFADFEDDLWEDRCRMVAGPFTA